MGKAEFPSYFIYKTDLITTFVSVETSSSLPAHPVEETEDETNEDEEDEAREPDTNIVSEKYYYDQLTISSKFLINFKFKNEML